MEFDRPGFDRQVGLRLQRARKVLSMTQEEVAKRIGIPRPSYANIESGRQRVPVDVLWRAAIVLDTSINALVPEPEKRRRPLADVVPIRRAFVSTGIAPLDIGSATAASDLGMTDTHPFPIGVASARGYLDD